MKLMKGDIWSIYNQTDVFLFTANSTVKNTGALVMGRGLARQVRDRLSGVDKVIGARILQLSPIQETYKNCLLVRVKWEVVLTLNSKTGGPMIGAFQVKYEFDKPADLVLIRSSVTHLKEMATSYPMRRFDMNFPGIGAGQLAREVVLPEIESLPDNVYIWERK